MKNWSCLFAVLLITTFGVAAEAQTISAVYTDYSPSGVPTKLNITGTAFCTTNPCAAAKAPVVRLAGNIVAISGSSPTGIGVPLTGVFADGDYLLSVTPYGKGAINYAFTLKGNTGGGATGPQGPIGPTGPAGPVGPAGPQGPQGLLGDTGAAGTNGSQGPMGLQGLKGDKGDKGDTGIAGPQGLKGDKGEAGSANVPSGNAFGDLLYWNGSGWAVFDVPADTLNTTLRLCNGFPMWANVCPDPLLTVSVPGNAPPYHQAVNPQLPNSYYYTEGTAEPVVVKISNHGWQEGRPISFRCSGGDGPQWGNVNWGCGGINTFPYSTTPFDPGYYAQPCYSIQAMGVFTDVNGTVIGSPFCIGSQVAVHIVPVGATQLQLGINDALLADNELTPLTISITW